MVDQTDAYEIGSGAYHPKDNPKSWRIGVPPEAAARVERARVEQEQLWVLVRTLHDKTDEFPWIDRAVSAPDAFFEVVLPEGPPPGLPPGTGGE